MLLSSPLFVFLFLPITIAGFFLCGRFGGARTALAWICITSLVFYLHWNPAHAWVLALTLAWNYLIARHLVQQDAARKRTVLVIGVIGNAGFLALFKVMAGGIWDNSGGFSASTDILIPLAISFITFQQIAFIIDVYKRRIKAINFLDYLAFILFFPQLVMGPIVHYRDIRPQFHHRDWTRWDHENVSVGLAIFIIGLFKKLVIADSMAPYVNEAFADTRSLHAIDAWTAVLGFQLQLYFDFSGYADMAIGIARMMNIRLPINFDSPYKATNRFEVWRRWHISFAAFMRPYIFFPLARNRFIPINATQALFLTALFSGFWHGFGWTFLLWGLAQALLMLGIHWRRHVIQQLPKRIQACPIPLFVQVLCTFLITLLLGALFRSPDIASAGQLYLAMFHGNGVTAPREGARLVDGALGSWLLLAAFITWCLPNTQQFFSSLWNAMDQRHEKPKTTWAGLMPYLADRLRFRLDGYWAVIMGLLFACCIVCMDRSSRFIYYQF